MSTFNCPKCGGDLACLGGCSAHETNWYCKDEVGCGYQAWDEKTWKKNRKTWKGTLFGQLPSNASDYKLMEQRKEKK